MNHQTQPIRTQANQQRIEKFSFKVGASRKKYAKTTNPFDDSSQAYNIGIATSSPGSFGNSVKMQILQRQKKVY